MNKDHVKYYQYRAAAKAVCMAHRIDDDFLYETEEENVSDLNNAMSKYDKEILDEYNLVSNLLLNAATNVNIDSIREIPDKFWNEELFHHVLNIHEELGMASYIPDSAWTEAIANELCENNGWFIQCVPPRLQTENLVRTACENIDWEELSKVDLEEIHYNLKPEYRNLISEYSHAVTNMPMP